MERIGPYLVERRLGGGGMGVVYAARHAESGARRAVKTLAEHTRAQVAGLRAEAAALARLDHPGIVRVHEHGTHEGRPYLAMDLLDGESLETAAKTLVFSRSRPLASGATRVGWSSVLDDATRVIPPLREAAVPPSREVAAPVEPPARLQFDEAHMRRIAAIAARLARALAYAHGEGIVHRDLKPDNIVLVAGDRPVLVDFGIAKPRRLASRERLEIDRQIVGTAAYVAPEQILGEPADPRSDLYALGCVLYRLLAERPPFVGPSAAAVLRAHLHEPAAPPSLHVEGLPPELDALVLSLLEKDPRARLPYAEDVTRRLAALGLCPEPEAGEPSARAYVYAPACVGRGSELAECAARIDRALGAEGEPPGGGVAITIAGESGVGKTRFLAELVRACPREVTLLTAEAEPRAADAPGPERFTLAPLLSLLAERAEGRDLARVRAWLGEHVQLLALLAPELAPLAGDEPAPPLPRPEQIAAASAQALCEVVLRLAEDEPLLLVLDDLQWADPITLDLIERLSTDERLRGARVALVAAYRAEEAERAWLSGGLAGALGLRLAPLPEGAMLRAAGAMLGLPEAALELPAVRGLVERASHSPFALVELTRLAVEDGALSRVEGAWQLDVRASDALEDRARGLGAAIAARRLARLDATRRALVEALAVAGGRLAVDLALDLALGPAPLREHEDRAFAALAELVRSGVVVDAAPGELAFAHDKLREAVLAALPEARLAPLHAQLAAALAAEGSLTAEREAEIGEHWAAAGAVAEATRRYLSAAERFEQRGAIAPMMTCLAAATAVTAGQHGEERRHAAVRMGAALVSLGRVDEGAPLLEEAEALATLAADHASLAAALVGLAYAAYLRGDGPALLERATRAAALAQQVGDERLQGRAQNALGIAHGSSGRFRTAISHYERAAELAERSGDVASLGKHRSNISINWRLLGELGLALDAARAAVTLTARSATSHANAWSNLGRVLLERGELPEAREAFLRANELAAKLDYAVVRVEASWGLAEIARRSGDDDEARALAEAVLTLARARGYAVSQGQALRTLALLDLARCGDPRTDPGARDAISRLAHSVEIIAPTQEKDELADGLWALAEGLERVGELEAAVERRGEALALYRELMMAGRLRAAGVT